MTGRRGELLWEPSDDRVERANITRYARELRDAGVAIDPADYDSIWRWSVANIGTFWQSVARFYDIGDLTSGVALASRNMPGAQWFPDARVNFASHAVARDDESPALLFQGETTDLGILSARELRDMVLRVGAGLRALGVDRGDRVVAVLPNVPEAVIACLAAASIGAIWSCCSPDFGVQSIVDRFRQIEPTLLVAVDGYEYGGRRFDRSEVIDRLRAEIPSIEHTVIVTGPGSHERRRIAHAVGWEQLLTAPPVESFDGVPFDQPLWILFSSGTTGPPKPIVHSHGGMLLEQLRASGLQLNANKHDRVLWYGSTGWAVWNMLLGVLTLGAAPVLYDGSPSYPTIGRIWDLAAETGATIVGAGAPLFHATMRANYAPKRAHDLSRLQTVASTGSPLSPDAFRWMYESINTDLMVAPLSGGTDICSAFVGPCPSLPVWTGEMSCRYLGADVRSFDEHGHDIVDSVGELVLAAPLPSMPVAFWNDPHDERYRESYFALFPGVWRHGDWIEITDRGSCIISGRSDATLKRSGVRMGTSEFYAVLDRSDEVVDSLIVDIGESSSDGSLVLFVVLDPDTVLDDELRGRLRALIREQLSPRHVPERIIQIPAVPTTLTGKKTEIPVKRVLLGTEIADAVNLDSLSNPDAMQVFGDLRRSLIGTD